MNPTPHTHPITSTTGIQTPEAAAPEAPTALAKGLLLAAVGLFTAAAVVGVTDRPSAGVIAQTVANATFVVVGGLIVLRRPGNLIGPLVVGFGLGFESLIAAAALAEVTNDAGMTGAAEWFALLGDAMFPVIAALMIPMFILFPDGHGRELWRRRFLGASAVYTAVLSAVILLSTPSSTSPTSTSEGEALGHPFVSESTSAAMGDLGGLLTFGLILILLFSACSLVLKWRRSGPIERRQIGWLALGATVYIPITILNGFLAEAGTIDDDRFLVIDAVGVILVPLAILVAIMRYRLYDIDTIVNRSFLFGTLAAFIASVYIAIVVGLSGVLGGGSSFELSILATVLVALAFQPARVRVERWANRLVYGQRSTPHEILQRFSRGSTDTSDDELLAQIPHLVVDGCGAATAAVWVRSGEAFETASTWPEDAPRRSVPGSGDFVDPDADLSVPVVHDGELLGGISLVKSAGETVTPQDEALIGSLASGIGLAMRNTRLTARLRQRVAELEASRGRVLVAADAARRALEHSLDSGPQQVLVAVKVGLGPTRMRAERAGAEKTAALLAQLEAAAGSAIESLRDFAAGIYPPLLEAEGLPVAISHQAAKAAVQVSVHADDLPRYDREVEAAVYFSVLESLQNCAKYSGASEAWVTLSNGDGQLRFEVRDEGRGFDTASVDHGAGLNGMTDRLDTVGGTVVIDAAPGRGTVVRGAIPVGEPATV